MISFSIRSYAQYITGTVASGAGRAGRASTEDGEQFILNPATVVDASPAVGEFFYASGSELPGEKDQYYGLTVTDWHNSYSTSAGEIPMSGQISFTGGQNDGAGSAIRGAITQGSGNYFLTTEFADAAGTGQAGQGASTNGSNGQVYGYGYRFSFTNGQYQSTGPARAISNVYEYDLTTGQQTSSSWTCENFEILYPGDPGRSSGVPPWTPIANPQPANALQAAALQMLPNWQFDEYGNFVMPPTSVTSGDFCEGTLQMHPQGSYTTPSNTLYYDSTHSGGGTCSTSLNNCPHLVSVCVRNN